MSGTLNVVATPIGNLEDITLRALRVLREADALYCEDTRKTRALLSRHEVTPPRAMVSYHEHNADSRVAELLARLEAGEQVCLVTDAGTPGISDPGYRAVRAARQAGYAVVPIPGACAAVAALSASGLPTDRFTFVGFPPKKPGARGRFLDELATAAGTLVLYVAGREVPDVLTDIAKTRGNPEVVVFRELTKLYEECMRGTASEVAAAWRAEPRKGEVTILADRPPERDFDDAALLELLRAHPVAQVAEMTGVSKRRVYQLNLLLK